MEISDRLRNIKGSATSIIFAKAKDLEAEGNEIIHLEIGQPDYPPPEVVINATIQALQENKTSYTVSRGIEGLRKKIAEHHRNENNVEIDYRTEVIVTSGAKLSIFASLWSVCNPGDNVIVLNPSWVSYGDIIESLGSEVRFFGVDGEFNFDSDNLITKMDSRTKALILNSPTNPTGGIITKDNLKKLVDICKERQILIISDEIYNYYLYDGAIHNSLLDIEGWKDIGVVVNGFSKSFSMTGFRLGYVLGTKKIIDQINKVIQLTSSCPVNFAQHAAITALDHVEEMKKFIDKTMSKRRNIAIEQFDKIGLDVIVPKGAIYIWFKIPSDDSVKWASDLLQEQGVGLTPGRAFGPDGEGFARICFATNEEDLRRGIEKIGIFVKSKN